MRQREPVAHTKPGTLLKSSIEFKTWADWTDVEPGFIEIDLVGHEGGDNNGHFFYTLNATDIATGWVETITVKSKGQRIVAAGVEHLINQFPFLVVGIHSDNGSEFINEHLVRFCERHQLTFTRGRPHHSNDQAYIEQKNWSIVRHAAGYYRYDKPKELALLNQLWPLWNERNNLLVPSQKQISKTRQGARLIKRYDTATTPVDRLLNHHAHLLEATEIQALQTRIHALNPVSILTETNMIQANLLELARQRGHITRRAKRNATYLNKTKLNKPTKTPQKQTTSDNLNTRAS